MTIMESFYTVVSGNSTITNGLASADSIFAQALPQNHDGFPALVFSLQREDDLSLLDGSLNELKRATIRVDVWATTYLSAITVADTVKTQLTGMRGTFGANTAERVSKSNEFDVPAEPDTGLNRVSLDFDVAYH